MSINVNAHIKTIIQFSHVSNTQFSLGYFKQINFIIKILVHVQPNEDKCLPLFRVIVSSYHYINPQATVNNLKFRTLFPCHFGLNFAFYAVVS